MIEITEFLADDLIEKLQDDFDDAIDEEEQQQCSQYIQELKRAKEIAKIKREKI